MAGNKSGNNIKPFVAEEAKSTLVKALAEGYGEWLLDPGYPIGILDLQAGEPFPLSPEVMLDVHPTPHTSESVAIAVTAPDGRLVYCADGRDCETAEGSSARGAGNRLSQGGGFAAGALR